MARGRQSGHHALVVEWSEQDIAAKVAKDIDGLTSYGERVGFVRVRLGLVPTEDGGRRSHIFSGYRSSWHWGERNDEGLAVHHDAPVTFEGSDRLALGTEATARLYPLFPEYWSAVKPGQRIEMREGARVVGIATIIESLLVPSGT